VVNQATFQENVAEYSDQHMSADLPGQDPDHVPGLTTKTKKNGLNVVAHAQVTADLDPGLETPNEDPGPHANHRHVEIHVGQDPKIENLAPGLVIGEGLAQSPPTRIKDQDQILGTEESPAKSPRKTADPDQRTNPRRTLAVLHLNHPE